MLSNPFDPKRMTYGMCCWCKYPVEVYDHFGYCPSGRLEGEKMHSECLRDAIDEIESKYKE